MRHHTTPLKNLPSRANDISAPGAARMNNAIVNGGPILNSVQIDPFGPMRQNWSDLFQPEDFENLDITLDAHEKILWYHMKPQERPSFTFGLLQEIRRFQTSVNDLFANTEQNEAAVRYVILASRMPAIFNLGGDLRLLSQLIRTRNFDGLRRYARACIDVLYSNAINLGEPIITISLVQGDALGGGFEAALSSNLLVAEKSAKFGLPEVLFNLFPGMGAYSFLSRRIGAVETEKMIFSGKIYGAPELHEMGIVDILADDGAGEEAIYEYIERQGRRFNSRRAVYQTRQCVNPVTRQELDRVTDIWVEAATHVVDADLRRMDRLASSQDRRWAEALQHLA